MKTINTPKIVIGSSLESVLFASKNNCMLILNKLSPPEIFETKELDDWNHLVFLLSMAGRIPFSDKVASIRVLQDEKKLKVYTTRERVVQLNCNEVVNEIVFYKSPRIDGDHDYKDLVTISYLTDEQIKDHSYSELMVLYKTKDIMKSYGIKGPRNGRDTANPEKYKYCG